MRWRKLGHVYAPSGAEPWAVSHATNPTAVHLEGDRYRIYFSTRDERQRSSIGFIEIDLTRPLEIISESKEPVLRPGELGMFDDCGVSIGCILTVGGHSYLYYMGWNLAVTVPWKNAVGLAICDGHHGPFRRHSRFPILDLNEMDPYTISYPWVVQEAGRFRMWYGSNIGWGPETRDMRHLIKYAESEDGLSWVRDGTVALGFDFEGEYALVRPCVRGDEKNGYRMWFCSRGEKYRIRLATSEDGMKWKRADECAGIDVSAAGWDSDMIEYPFVFSHQGTEYMLYCGNDYGRSGFGIAVAEVEASRSAVR